eukprot:6185380-Pleurochrysis_carterae.AAC.4
MSGTSLRMKRVPRVVSAPRRGVPLLAKAGLGSMKRPATNLELEWLARTFSAERELFMAVSEHSSF